MTKKPVHEDVARKVKELASQNVRRHKSSIVENRPIYPR